MKALTIRQPWASLILSFDENGRPNKMIETRSWKTSYRGRLAIHSAKFIPDKFFIDMAMSKMQHFILAGLDGDFSLIELPYGAVIGSVCLVDCLPMSELIGSAYDTERERAFGDWSIGKYGWILGSPVVFEKPIPATGKQGLWEWTQQI